MVPQKQTIANQINKENECYVAFDFGSETMAAYYEKKQTLERDMIKLQYHAPTLLNTNGVDYVWENDKTISPRLRTRICLEDNCQPEELSDDHAELDFIGESNYSKSLFSYFQGSTMKYVNINFLPNPKIPFQEGGEQIIPMVKSDSNSIVKHKPEKLIQHMTTQIIKNFILQSPELKDISPQDIHLTLTMPNVYSLAHVESITDFVRKHTNLASVNYLYESDAVAYFIMSQVTGDQPEIDAIKRRLEGCLKNHGKVHIMTVDVGKGTTDLSLIQIKSPTIKHTSRQHFVMARTGCSSGGNLLSYHFVKYYEELLKKNSVHDFSFLTILKEDPVEQYRVLRTLESLIERIKANIDENFQINLSTEEQLGSIELMADKIFEIIDPQFRDKPSMMEQHKKLMDEMILKPLSLVENLTPELSVLKRHIDGYIRINSEEVIDRLVDMAVMKQTVDNDDDKKDLQRNNQAEIKEIKELLFAKEYTIVVIAGQASQFKPLKQAIKTKLSKMNLTAEQSLDLKGPLAKESCCKGAVIYQRSMAKSMNQYEIHGTYGFLAATLSEEKFKPVNMSVINFGNEDEVEFYTKQEYQFIFSPQVFGGHFEEPTEGSIALIKNFTGTRFKVKYDLDRNKIMVAEVPETDPKNLPKLHYCETELANFGSIRESIYPKVWPEVLMPVGKGNSK